MALIEHARMRKLAASGGGSLEAPNHESYRVRGIHCVPSTNDTFLTVIIDGTTVGKLRVKGKSGNHCPYPAVTTAQIYEATVGGLMGEARARGFDMSFPVAAGQVLTVSRYAEAGNVGLVYDVFDRDDVAADEPNGSEATIRRYIHYMENASAFATSPGPLDKSLLWPGMHTWPVGGRQVPHNTTIRIAAVVGCPCALGNDAATMGYTTYLQLLREGNVLFDSEQNGIPFLADASYVTSTVGYVPKGSEVGPLTAEHPTGPLWLPEPLVFLAGETLTPQVACANLTGSGIAAAGLDVALLIEREVAA